MYATSLLRLLYILFAIIPLDIVDSLPEFLDTYDVVECKITVFGNKKSLSVQEGNDKLPGNKADAEVKFKSYNKNFHLLLYEDKGFKAISAVSYSLKSLVKLNAVATFYEGVLQHKPFTSSVIGYLHNESFWGIIKDNYSTYFIEPAVLHFSNMSDFTKVVVYRSNDIHRLSWNISQVFPTFSAWKLVYKTPNITTKSTIIHKGLELQRTTDVFCEMEIVADHTLYNYFNKDVDRMSAYMYLHGKFSDDIFRKTDFNMDGRPDGIRISVARISYYETLQDSNYPMANSPDISDYLEKFVYRKQDSKFCLSMSLTYRGYEGLVIGEAFKPDTRYSFGLGGICQTPILDTDGSTLLYFNTGVINLRVRNSTLLPLGITTLALTHEIGHCFGSEHDPLVDPVCSSDYEVGSYLMYPVLTYNSIHVKQFSPCSRRDIWKLILRKGECLREKEAVCGNSIRELNEECDCGSKVSCEAIDPCCIPYDTESNETRCRIARKKGFTCSPKESICCTDKCTVESNKEIKCFSDEFLCLESFCDGKNSECPPPKRSRTVITCKLMATPCEGDTCNYSVCLNNGLSLCSCKSDLTKECLICCMKNNTCVPASELGSYASSGYPYVHKPGVHCHSGKFRCDGMGNCIEAKHLSHRTALSPQYATIIVVTVCVSLLLILAIYFSYLKKQRINTLLISRAT